MKRFLDILIWHSSPPPIFTKMTRFYFGFIWVGQIQVFLLMVSQMWTNFLYEHSIRGGDSHQQSSVWYLPFSVKRGNSKVETWEMSNSKYWMCSNMLHSSWNLQHAIANSKYHIFLNISSREYSWALYEWNIHIELLSIPHLKTKCTKKQTIKS